MPNDIWYFDDIYHIFNFRFLPTIGIFPMELSKNWHLKFACFPYITVLPDIRYLDHLRGFFKSFFFVCKFPRSLQLVEGIKSSTRPNGAAIYGFIYKSVNLLVNAHYYKVCVTIGNFCAIFVNKIVRIL